MVIVNSPTLVDNNEFCLLNSSCGSVNLHNNSHLGIHTFNNNNSQQQRSQPIVGVTTNSTTSCYGGIYVQHEYIDLPAHQQSYVQTVMPLSSNGSLAAATLHNQPHHHITAADYSYPPPPSSALTHQQQHGIQQHHIHHQQQFPGSFLPPFFDNVQSQAFTNGGNLINADGSTNNVNSFPAAMFTTANIHPSFMPVHQNTATLIVNGNGNPTVGTALNVNFHQNHSSSAPHIIGDLYQKHNGMTGTATVVYSATVFDSSDAGSGGSLKDLNLSLPTSAASDTTTSSNNSSTGGGTCKISNGKILKSKQRKLNSSTTAATTSTATNQQQQQQQQQQQCVTSANTLMNNSPSTSKSADSTHDVTDGGSGYLVESIDSGLAADNSSPEHHARCSSAGAHGINYHAVAPPVYGGVGSADGSYGTSGNHISSMGGGSNRNQETAAGNSRSRGGIANVVGHGPSGSGCGGGGGGGSNGDSRTSSPPALVDSSGAGAPSVGPHAVYVHVNLGETLSVRVGNDIQHIPGPATVRMVSSHDSAPPVPLPLHVPPGHIVQQIVDERGVLKHLILSPQTPPITAGPFPCRNMPNGPMAPNVQFVPVQNGHVDGLTPTAVPTGSLAHSPPPYFSSIPALHTDPLHVCQLHISQEEAPFSNNKPLRVPKGFPKRKTDMFSDCRNVDVDHESADVAMDDNTSAATSGTEDEEIAKIAEMLSKIQPPQVCDIGPRDALVQWQPLDCSEASASGGPFPQIDASEFTYEVMVYERKPDGENRNNYRCQADNSHQMLTNLKPSTEYFVRLRALLEERGLNGEPSSPVGFKTKPTHPDKPRVPHISQKTKTSVVLRWVPPCENGSRITAYHLEIDDTQQNTGASSSSSSNGGGNPDNCFREIFCNITKQFKVHKLQPSTLYRFRLAASNQHGKSEYSDVLLVQTAGAAPQTPDPPQLVQTTSHSLSLAWEKRDGDDEFELLMEDPLTGYGFLPVCVTHESTYVVPSLQKNKDYRFRLCASNEEGKSQQSDVLTCRTLPGRPQTPNKPSLKGKVSSTNLKISWDPPKDTGGGEIIGYRLEFDNGTNGGSWSEIYDGNELEHLVSGLQPGASYKFRVACTSLGGQSSFSEPFNVSTLPVAPGLCRPPTIVGKPKSNSLNLKWSSPETSGGSEITEYEVNMEWAENPFSRQTPCIVYHGAKNECVVGGLTPGRSYGFRVRAHNKAGSGHWSDCFECQTGAAPPEHPQNLRCAVSHSTCLHLQWDVPTTCNGSPITEYRLQQASRKSVSFQVPDVLPTGLLVSNVGSNVIDIDMTLLPSPLSAGVVQSSSASTASSSSSVNSPTALTNGVAFTELEFGPFVQVYCGVNLTHETRGLSPASDYAFRVQAVNSAGISKFSPTILVRTPPGPPDAPINLSTETASTTEIAVYWESPCDNGSALIGYNLDVQPAPDDTTLPIQLPAYCTQHVVDNLKPESAYRFRIQAFNDVAAGPYSSSIRATTFSRPPPPPLLEISSVSHNSLKLKWSEPKTSSSSTSSSSLSNGIGSQSETFTYTVEMENKIGAFSPVFDGNARSCKVPRLNESTVYRFRLRACASTGGVGPWSDLYSFKTSRAPPPAIKSAPKVSETGETSYQIEWQPVKMPLNAGEKLIYCLQTSSSSRPTSVTVSSSIDEFKTVYKGVSTNYTLTGLVHGASYRVRIAAIRCSPDCDDGSEIETFGAWSSLASFSIPSLQLGHHRISDSSEITNTSSTEASGIVSGEWSDRQWAVLILVGFSLIALLFAVLLQRFVATER